VTPSRWVDPGLRRDDDKRGWIAAAVCASRWRSAGQLRVI